MGLLWVRVSPDHPPAKTAAEQGLRNKVVLAYSFLNNQKVTVFYLLTKFSIC